MCKVGTLCKSVIVLFLKEWISFSEVYRSVNYIGSHAK